MTIITCCWQLQPLSITHLFIRNAPHFYHQYWVGWLMATKISIVQYTVGYFFLLISNLVTAYNHWRAGGGDRAQENVLCWNCLNIFNFIMCKIKLYWEVKISFFHHFFVDCMVFSFLLYRKAGGSRISILFFHYNYPISTYVICGVYFHDNWIIFVRDEPYVNIYNNQCLSYLVKRSCYWRGDICTRWQQVFLSHVRGCTTENYCHRTKINIHNNLAQGSLPIIPTILWSIVDLYRI